MNNFASQIINNRIKLLSFVLLILCAIFSTGYYQFDEHFQILEFAGLKLNLTNADNLPWEYHEKMRAAVQPSIVYVIYSLFKILGCENPFHVSLVLRLISALFAFVSFMLFYRMYIIQIKDKLLQKWFLILSFLLWFLIFKSVRFSSENWSGLFFAFGFAYYFIRNRMNATNSLLIGFLFGLSFIFRYQTGLMIGGFLLWMSVINKQKIKYLTLISAGISISIVIGCLIDRWYYGAWTSTAWNYFQNNILENKISNFGVDPWWYYFSISFIKLIPPFSILIILSILIVILFDRKNPVTWSLLPYLLIHFCIGHKELRFLTSIVIFIPILIIRAIEILQEETKIIFIQKKSFSIFMNLFFVCNYICLVPIVFFPADNNIGVYKYIYDNYKKPTTLYYTDANPYDRILNINFYKRQNLTIKKINSIDSLETLHSNNILIISNHWSENGYLFKSHKLIYSNFPSWVTKFNINNWLSRTKVWSLYEL